MTGYLFDVLLLLVITLVVTTFLILPGLSAASTTKNLGALVLALTLALGWVLWARATWKGSR